MQVNILAYNLFSNNSKSIMYIEVKDQTISEMANKLKFSQGRIDLNENLIKDIKESQKNKKK